MANYVTRVERSGLTIIDEKNNYTLSIVNDPKLAGTLYGVSFIVSDISTRFGDMTITGRDMSEYPKELISLPFKDYNRILEVGSGLGELPFHMNHERHPKQHNIIIVDPANYELMYEMLEHAAEYACVRGKNRKKVNKLKRRCETILQGKTFDLINTTIEDAIAQRPELLGNIDLVVEHFGPSHYFEGDHAEIEKRLLAAKGILSRHIGTTQHQGN